MIEIRWITHPRHLPKPPAARAVVVDVAFAAGKQFEQKTRPFIERLGDRLLAWVDHHEHREGWPQFRDDERFVLVPNRTAHACPELITPALVERMERAARPDIIYAHCDFDGALAAVKWRLRGAEPWAGADEDARAVDSPGRGHALSVRGARIADAMDEATAIFDRDGRKRFMTSVADAITAGEESIALAEEIDQLASRADVARGEAERIAQEHGREEVPGVYVVRVEAPPDNRLRRNLLMAAETRARIGAIYEPDKEHGHWLIAATFDEAIDLEDVDGFEGGRSDYRFARAHGDGQAQVEALGAYLSGGSG